MKMNLILLPDKYSIHKFVNITDIPATVNMTEFYSITTTKDEISVVSVQTDSDKEKSDCSIDWRILKIAGQLDFSLVGVIAAISQILKEENIPIFTISTFNTDYILIRQINLRSGIKALEKNGYFIL
jgi:hypothetical protein